MDHHEKLSWSAQHLHALDLEIKDFVKRHPFSARGEQQDNPLRWRIIANPHPPLPGHWALMVGDAIHNLRGALDHIVWELSQRASPRPSDDAALKIQYPICTEKGRYFGAAKDKGKGGQRHRCARFVGARALALIDATQPYHRGDRAHEHPLAIIARYSNEDKHRKLFASAVVAKDVQFTFLNVAQGGHQFRLGAITFEVATNRIDDGAELGFIEFGEGTTYTPGKMGMEAILTGTVAFGKAGGDPLLAVPFLEEILDRVHRQVVQPLDEVLLSSGGGT